MVYIMILKVAKSLFNQEDRLPSIEVEISYGPLYYYCIMEVPTAFFLFFIRYGLIELHPKLAKKSFGIVKDSLIFTYTPNLQRKFWFSQGFFNFYLLSVVWMR